MDLTGDQAASDRLSLVVGLLEDRPTTHSDMNLFGLEGVQLCWLQETLRKPGGRAAGSGELVVLSSQKPCADTGRGPFCSAGQSPRSLNARAKGEGWVTSRGRHGYHVCLFVFCINLVPYDLPLGG